MKHIEDEAPAVLKWLAVDEVNDLLPYADTVVPNRITEKPRTIRQLNSSPELHRVIGVKIDIEETFFVGPRNAEDRFDVLVTRF